MEIYNLSIINPFLLIIILFRFEKIQELDEPYFYHAKILEILSYTAFGVNGIELKGIFNFEYLL